MSCATMLLPLSDILLCACVIRSHGDHPIFDPFLRALPGGAAAGVLNNELRQVVSLHNPCLLYDQLRSTWCTDAPRVRGDF